MHAFLTEGKHSHLFIFGNTVVYWLVIYVHFISLNRIISTSYAL
uniref:Uncharacterized protein n=1 Tax=Anguilla anguilla TaxID=7936 RepID=A0A0E9UQS0_ANGAN